MSKQWCPTCKFWATLVPIPNGDEYDDVACWQCGAILDAASSETEGVAL